MNRCQDFLTREEKDGEGEFSGRDWQLLNEIDSKFCSRLKIFLAQRLLLLFVGTKKIKDRQTGILNVSICYEKEKKKKCW